MWRSFGVLRAAVAFAGSACVAGVVWAGPSQRAPKPARLQSLHVLSTPIRDFVQQDSTLFCFEGFLSGIVNPACFTAPPQQPEPDCISSSDHFFVQIQFPAYAEPYRITGFGFVSNDGNTVFPSAGIVLLPLDALGNPTRFPTPEELANLPVKDIATPGDTSVVFVDVSAESLIIGPGDIGVAVALQFPDGGELAGIADGPGILADADPPDQVCFEGACCDLFTLDGGASQDESWYSPVYDPVNFPDDPPLDWGFVVTVEPADPVSVEQRDWTHVKRLYRTP